MIIQDVEMKRSHNLPAVILSHGLFEDAFPEPQADVFVFVCARVLVRACTCAWRPWGTALAFLPALVITM